jgi:hypothetical protein
MRSPAVSPVLALLLLLSACASGEKPPYEVEYRDPVLKEALRDGFAMAPVTQVAPIPGGRDALARITNDLYTALLVFTEGTEILEPGVVIKRIDNAGEDFQVFAREFRRSRIAGDKLSQSDTARLYAQVAERFLMVAWVLEQGEVGVKDSASADYQDLDFAQDIYDVAYKSFKGELTVEMIDLVRGELVWRGVARYSTGEMYADNQPADLWARRSQACTAAARLLSLD